MENQFAEYLEKVVVKVRNGEAGYVMEHLSTRPDTTLLNMYGSFIGDPDGVAKGRMFMCNAIMEYIKSLASKTTAATA